MDPTSLIALYGALLSTAIALSQLAKWALSHRSRIRIDVDAGEGPAWRTGKFAGKGSVVLWIDVINEGARDEQVAWLKVDQLHPEATWRDSGFGEEHVILPRHRKTYLCAEIPAGEDGTDMELDAIEGPFRARVVTGTGREFFSDTQPTPSRA